MTACVLVEETSPGATLVSVTGEVLSAPTSVRVLVGVPPFEVVAPELPMEIRLYRNPARGRGLAGRVWNAATTLPQGYADSE